MGPVVGSVLGCVPHVIYICPSNEMLPASELIVVIDVVVASKVHNDPSVSGSPCSRLERGLSSLERKSSSDSLNNT